MDFIVGDVVRLNSGGPDMTVLTVGEKKFPHGGSVPNVYCQWFVGTKLEGNNFDPKQLTKVEKPNK